MPYIGNFDAPEIQLEALQTLFNLCTLSSLRQEAAAVAGAVKPLLMLAGRPAGAVGGGPSSIPAIGASDPLSAPETGPGSSMGPRQLAMWLLCKMAHGTQRTRNALWSHNSADVLLDMLRDDNDWQVGRLDWAFKT